MQKTPLDRNYSQGDSALRIGYAGRLRRVQKRLDLILDVAEKLKKREVDFFLELAGIGDYEDTLRIEITKRGLTENVALKGMIKHENIPQFWKEQDIYLSCSDWEGHSISQSEAMAAGAVLVVTNTSGAEDDIQSGYNGYIANMRDTDALVWYIEHLARNRELLPVMGKRCHDRIWERNQSVDEAGYWRELLEK